VIPRVRILIPRRQLVGESDPKMAPLLLSYGKALYELAFSQQGVMGKEEVDKSAGQGACFLFLFSLSSLHGPV
jgi:hypothetical protein